MAVLRHWPFTLCRPSDCVRRRRSHPRLRPFASSSSPLSSPLPRVPPRCCTAAMTPPLALIASRPSVGLACSSKLTSCAACRSARIAVAKCLSPCRPVAARRATLLHVLINDAFGADCRQRLVRRWRLAPMLVRSCDQYRRGRRQLPNGRLGIAIHHSHTNTNVSAGHACWHQRAFVAPKTNQTGFTPTERDSGRSQDEVRRSQTKSERSQKLARARNELPRGTQLEPDERHNPGPDSA